MDELAGKRLGLVHDLAPAASVVALLLNPAGPNAESNLRETEVAARRIGLDILRLNASNESEIDAALAAIPQTRAAALLVGAECTSIAVVIKL